jgi:hypothetical protein
MSPELKEHRELAEEALLKAQELFEPLHPFVAMMVLSTTIAHWVVSHSPKDRDRVWTALKITVIEMLMELDDDDETVH